VWEDLLPLRTRVLPAQQGWLTACHRAAAKGLVRSATLSARRPDLSPPPRRRPEMSDLSMHTGSGVMHTRTESWPSGLRKRGVMTPTPRSRPRHPGADPPGTQELKGGAGCSGSENSGHPFVARWSD
jgi:hypothetical protein